MEGFILQDQTVSSYRESRISKTQNQKPPLLPLPTSNLNLHHYKSNQHRSRKFEHKDRSIERHVKKVASLNDKPNRCLFMASITRLGPDPSDLPKEVPGIFRSFSCNRDMKYYSVSAISSPPPSSLPLPRFSLKGKVGCNAQAGGIDAGATDNLRKLLKLH